MNENAISKKSDNESKKMKFETKSRMWKWKYRQSSFE